MVAQTNQLAEKTALDSQSQSTLVLASLSKIAELVDQPPHTILLSTLAVIVSRYLGNESVVLGKDDDIFCFLLGDKTRLVDLCNTPLRASEPLSPTLVLCHKSKAKTSNELEFGFALGEEFTVWYDNKQLAPTVKKRLLASLAVLVNSMVDQPDEVVEKLSILPLADQEILLHTWNDTTNYPVERLETMFEQQVFERGNAVAISTPTADHSYAEINTTADIITNALANTELDTGAVVATLIDDTVLQIGALFGILKANAAFVCLDPCHPDDRLMEIINEVKPKAIIVDSASLRHDNILRLAESLNTALLCIDASKPMFSGVTLLLNSNANEPVTPKGSVTDTAYLVYTSGSTGKPKGIIQSHKSFSQFIGWQSRELGIEPGQRLIQWASIGYDAAYCEIFGALCFGATLCVEIADVRFNPTRLMKWVRGTRATILQVVPSFCRQLVELMHEKAALPDLKHLMLAGEALPADLVRKWQSLVNSTVHNLYGPSESVLATFNQVKAVDLHWTYIPIGSAIDGRQILILDKFQNLCPIGAPGEIFIRSAYLTSGYFGRDEESATRFLQNPLHNDFQDPVFRTGDLARFTETGEIEFIGRVDRMIKLRGMRVELGEIEYAVRQFQGIKECVCLVLFLKRQQDRLTAKDRSARDALTSGSQFLVAYYTTDSRVLASSLREHLRMKLPAHMVPQQFVELEKMPVNVNNKLDLKALPDPANIRPELDVSYRKPTNSDEEKLVEIWSQVLGIDRVGIDDGFFDLGGDSLLGMQVINRAADQSLLLPARVILQNGSIALLVESAKNNNVKTRVPLTKIKRDFYPLTHAQWGLWYLWRIDPSNPYYTAQGSIHLRGDLDVSRWVSAWEKTVERHQALRSSYSMVDGQPVQKFRDNRAKTVDIVDLTHLEVSAARAEMDRLNTELGKYAFDLEHDQLLRPALYRIDAEYYEFVMTYHEVIFDLWGYAIIIRDIASFYENPNKVAALEFDLGDMAVWEEQERTRENLIEQGEYWREELSHKLPITNLPLDRPRKPVPDYAGAGATVLLDAELTAKLKQLASSNSASMFATLMAAFNLIIHTYAAQDDLVVGATVANRNGRAAEEMVGWFVNMVPVRVHIERDQSFTDLLRSVKAKTTECVANADYPFHWMIEHAEIHRDQSVAPIFQVMFNWQNLPQHSIEVEGLEITSSEVDSTYKKYDIALYAQEHLDHIYLQISYLSELFEHETIDRMLSNLVVLLENVCENPTQPISALKCVSNGETSKILTHFNKTRRELSEGFNPVVLFEQLVSSKPNSTALIFDDQELSYLALDNRVNQIASALVNADVVGGDKVALCLNRGFDTVASVIAVSKLGCVHAAIDPTHPEAHRLRVLVDTGARAYLHHEEYSPGDDYSGKTIAIDFLPDKEGEEELSARTSVQKNVYNVVYTSGSTGEPKSVIIPYLALQNRLEWMWRTYPWQEGDVALLQKSYSIVAASWEIWGALLKGVPTVILDQDNLHDPAQFVTICSKNKVTHLLSSPALITSVLSHAERQPIAWSSLRFATTSAEPISPALVQRWKNTFPKVPLINLYGSTECCSNVTAFNAVDINEPSLRVPIGKPLDNCAVYVTNKNMIPVPQGAAGEMCVTGACLALGYQNADSNSGKFVDNIFDDFSEKLYRTGDMVRINNRFELELLGREDQQVNIRGFRVELGGIESSMATFPGIEKCVVTVWKNGDGQRLCGYYSVQTSDISSTELRKHLRERLPDYMVPQHLLSLDTLPQTTTGKIDRAALPLPSDLEPEARSGIPPQTKTEMTIAKIWMQVLDIKNVYRKDYFFELGGHSLLALSVAQKIEEQLGVTLPFRTIVFSDLQIIAQSCDQSSASSLIPTLRKWWGNILGVLIGRRSGH